MDEKTTHDIVCEQRAYFRSGATRSLAGRVRALERLARVIRTRQDEIGDALYADLKKAPFEAYETEVGIVLEEIKVALRNIHRWARPERKPTPIVHFPSTSRVYSEPYGTVLIMAPWNYPFQLTMDPLVGALVAGNTAVLKPSAYAPATAALMADIVAEVFDPDYVTVIQGGREANQDLLAEEFDLIFFTGSPAVGKVAMHAAAEHLTPVVLELGGKSPCIVDSTADIGLAAKRIAWGKFLNAGQTCVAPDYIYAHQDVAGSLVDELQCAIEELYGADPISSPDYPRIVNARHFDRLRGLLGSGTIACGGEADATSNQIAPTILVDVTWDDAVMQEEIFGPILPILTYQDLQDVVDELALRPKPLACYLFCRNRGVERTILEHVSFGGGCINDTIVHLSNPALPFGGVGASGMGHYHGRYSFETFSHQKAVIKKSNLVDIPLRYPPFRKHLGLLRKVLG